MSTDSNTTHSIEFDDPSDQNQGQLYSQLNEARSEIHRVQNQTFQEVVYGNLSEMKACSLYRQALKSYIIQLAAYLRDENIDAGGGLWKEKELGTVTIRSPSYDGRVEKVEPEVVEVEINGLRDILQAPSPLVAEFTVHHRGNKASSSHKETVTQSAEIGWDILDEAWLELEEFRHEVGLLLSVANEVEDGSQSTF